MKVAKNEGRKAKNKGKKAKKRRIVTLKNEP